MLKNLLDQFRYPVTSMIEKSEQESLKKGLIKLLISSAIIAIVITLVSATFIISQYSTDSYRYRRYTSAELWEVRMEALEDAELLNMFFVLFIVALVMLLFTSLTLFLIAKFVKSPKKYASILSIINSTMTLLAICLAISVILLLVYRPIGLLALYATIIFVFLSMFNAFKDSLALENSDRLVIVTTAVYAALIVIVVVGFCVSVGISIKELLSFN